MPVDPTPIAGKASDTPSLGGGPPVPASQMDWRTYLRGTWRAMIMEKWYFSLCLLFFPAAIASDIAHAPAGCSFAFSALALVPLAERLGFVTEQLALHIGQAAAGLINVSMGNVPELIFLIVCIGNNQVDVAAGALLGGVLSNLLLVGGLSFFFSGIRRRHTSYSATLSSSLTQMIQLAATSFALCSMLPQVLKTMLDPQALQAYSKIPERMTPEDWTKVNKTVVQPTLLISRFLSLTLLVAYGCFLYFSLRTHKADLDAEEKEASRRAGVEAGGKGEGEDGGASDDDDDEEDVLGLAGSVFWMGLLIILISYLSDILVGAIDAAAVSMHVSSFFLAAVVVPNVNNAPEHAVAIQLAWRNRVSGTVAIAVGSAMQLATLLLPLGVILDWMVHGNRMGAMSLSFPIIEAAHFWLVTVLAVGIYNRGRSTWISGVVLIFAYLSVVGVWYCLPLVRTPAAAPPTMGANEQVPPAQLRLITAMGRHLAGNPGQAQPLQPHTS